LGTLEIILKKVLLLIQLWGRYFRKPWRLFEKVLSDPKNSLRSSVSHWSLLGALGITSKKVLLITSP